MKKQIAIITLISFIFTGGFGNEARAVATELASTSFYTDANLAAYYKLEDAVDSENDGTDYDLTNYNSVTFSSAKFNNGADFGTSNTNKALRVANDLGIDGGVSTFSFWMKVNTDPSSGVSYTLLDHRGGASGVKEWFIYENAAGTRRLTYSWGRNGVADYNINYNVTLSVGDWHHIAGTYNGTYIKLYLDGTQQGGDLAASGTGSGITDGFSLASTANGYVFGSIMLDDVAVFNRALSGSEIASIYDSGGSSSSSPAVANIINFE